MSIRDLYFERCKVVDGKPKPTFWKPTPVDYYPVCLYSSTDKTASQQAESLVRRLITLGLELEIEVGNFILSGVKKELPKADSELSLLLKSNAADESRHFRGFEFAAETYGQDPGDHTLDQICKGWISKANSCSNPIHIAGLMEASVFLISLGLLRIVGSPSLSRLAMAVAEDENRHVITNVAVSQGLGLWGQPDRETQDLIDTTIEWMWGDGVEGVPRDLNIHNLKTFSRELVSDLHSPRFDSLTYYSYHHLPFELPNDYMYSDREVDTSVA